MKTEANARCEAFIGNVRFSKVIFYSTHLNNEGNKRFYRKY
jgi:hypothetical protein